MLEARIANNLLDGDHVCTVIILRLTSLFSARYAQCCPQDFVKDEGAGLAFRRVGPR